MNPLIHPEAAMEQILRHSPRTGSISCPLAECAGRVLRETVHADRPFPPFDRAMLDGFALRATETGTGEPFIITGQAPAGHPRMRLGNQARACVEIMTGAMLPDGADCIVPYEDTQRLDGERMRIRGAARYQPGQAVHLRGSDHADQAPLLAPGIRLGSREIAVAATCGAEYLQVSEIPSIAIAGSGDELVELSARPEPHQIRRSNDFAILAALARAGFPARQRIHLPDDAEACLRELRSLVENNTFVILSGGISMGRKDHLPTVLDELGLIGVFHGVAQKPGKPMGFWRHRDGAVFALPGNPLSTLSCLHRYVIPALQTTQQWTQRHPAREVRLRQPVRVRKDFTVFMPVRLEEENRAVAVPPQNSGDLVAILQSDGYIAISDGVAEADESMVFAFHPWY
jgi:molybdopterin molybdotransferase